MERVAAGTSRSMPRTRRVDCSGPGIARRRHGRGFAYLDAHGARVEDPALLERIRALAIPPAWRDVWICPDPLGHIQATGIDAAGRKQYRYHDAWRRRRDAAKFDAMVDFARALPRLRRRVTRDLGREELDAARVHACAVRLLDIGFFRIGSEDYAVRNATYGLATMKKRHVRQRGDVLVFDYPAKHGKRRVQAVIDPAVAEVVAALKRRSGGGDELLAYKRGRRWVDVRSEDINAWLKEATGEDVSAKDFRTWGATVLAAVALAVSEEAAATKTGRKRAITRAIKEVAYYLGNTPAIARASYIDPRVFDRYREGKTIDYRLVAAASERNGDATAIQGPVEEAVLQLLAG
jgi:DNA topoisomerase-1